MCDAKIGCIIEDAKLSDVTLYSWHLHWPLKRVIIILNPFLSLGLGFSLWTDFLVDVAEALVIRHVEFGIHLLWNSVRNGDTQAKGHQIESKDSPSKIAQGQGPEVEHLMTERRHHNQSSFTNPDVRFPQWEGPPLGASLSSSQEVESKSARPNKMDRKIFVRNINYRVNIPRAHQDFNLIINYKY